MFDPEIPVNIWELGLIYDIVVDAAGVAGVRMTLTAPGCPAAQSLPVEVADKVKEVPGVTDAKVESCGNRAGRRIGCPRPRNCSWDCGDHDAAPIQESRLRAHRDEAPGDSPGRGLGQRPRDRRAVRHPGRADGEGAAAPGPPRPRDLAPGHARRLPPGASRVRHLGRRHHPGDRRTADRHRLLDRGGELRSVREVQRPRSALAHPRAHRLGARHLLAAGNLVGSAGDAPARGRRRRWRSPESSECRAAPGRSARDPIAVSNQARSRNAEARLPRLSRHDAGRSPRARGDAAVLHRRLRQSGEPPARVRLAGGRGGRLVPAAKSRRSSARRPARSSSRAARPNRTTWRSRARRTPAASAAITSSRWRPSTSRCSIRSRRSSARAGGSPGSASTPTGSSGSTSCARRSPTRPCSCR